ncbi:MAG: hypothetical protein WCT77_10325 [Bacteroidota bacterium]
MKNTQTTSFLKCYSINLFLCVLSLFLFSAFHLFSQDTLYSVIVSSRLGYEIDQEEREYFHLFQNINNFHQAEFYTNQKKEFFAILHLEKRKGVFLDTIINKYSENYILMLSEQIEHYEDYMKGKYELGNSPAKIIIDNTPAMIVFGSEISKFNLLNDSLYKDKKFKEQTVNLRKSKSNFLTDTIPFAKNKFSDEFTEYPRFNVFAGAYYFSPDLSALDKAFTAIEQVYTKQGYYLKSQKAFSLIMHYDVGMACRWRLLSIEMEGSSNFEEDNKFYSLSLNGSYYFKERGGDFTPFAGAGIGVFSLRAKHNYYSSRISPVDNNGGYSTLEFINADLGTVGYNMNAGIEFFNNWNYSLKLFVKYYLFPELKSDISQSDIFEKYKLNLSSFVIGCRFDIYW